MLHGHVAHKDSLGNQGVIGPGEVQWMTAGSRIIHQEMPDEKSGLLWGLQLWANLPASHKMMTPRYREILEKNIPEISPSVGVWLKVICGQLDGIRGPVEDIVTEPFYFDVSMDRQITWTHRISKDFNVFAYILEGQVSFGRYPDAAEAATLVTFKEGDHLEAVNKGDSGARFLLIGGKPICEPVAWGGPIVMNTHRENREE